jgi:hypothetical protein
MKHLKTFESYEPINESISDILYVAAIVFGSLFGLSLTATAIVLIKSKSMRTILKELFSNIPKMLRIRNKLKKSENYKDLMNLAKDFNKNPTEAKKKKIIDGLKDILDGDEVKEVQDLISKSNKEIMKSMKNESFSKIYENSGEKTTQEVIEKYKQMPGLWNMARDQYYNIIIGYEYSMEELKEYYPNWTIEDFKEVYLALEGELPEEDM